MIARNKLKLDKLKEELEKKYNVRVYCIGKDLSLKEAARDVYDELIQKNIAVDYLINNAGLGDFGFFSESDWSKQEKMISLNITALTYFTWLFLPDMIKRRDGKILNVSSTAAFQPGPTMSVYFATKAFVQSFSEAVNNEVRDKGITVTALCPGSTESGFHAAVIGEGKIVKSRKLPSSRLVAEYGYRAMMKGKSIAIHGLKNTILANLIRFVPRSLIVKVVRNIQSGKHSMDF